MSTSQCNNPGCEKAGEKRCSQCQSAFYCDESCQRSNWKEHRPECKEIKKQQDEVKLKDEGSVEVAPPSAWAVGLSPSQQREWLVDCYRMRLDDEMVWGGNIRSGSLYDPDHTPEEVVQNFLVFCRLALEQGALPQDWNWAAFLAKAADLLPYAFEKSDASEKYGFESIFHGLLPGAFPGSRSLRYTGEIIYGSASDGSESELHKKVQLEVLNKKRTNSMVANVGGKKSWEILEAKLMRKL